MLLHECTQPCRLAISIRRLLRIFEYLQLLYPSKKVNDEFGPTFCEPRFGDDVAGERQRFASNEIESVVSESAMRHQYLTAGEMHAVVQYIMSRQ